MAWGKSTKTRCISQRILRLQAGFFQEASEGGVIFLRRFVRHPKEMVGLVRESPQNAVGNIVICPNVWLLKLLFGKTMEDSDHWPWPRQGPASCSKNNLNSLQWAIWLFFLQTTHAHTHTNWNHWNVCVLGVTNNRIVLAWMMFQLKSMMMIGPVWRQQKRCVVSIVPQGEVPSKNEESRPVFVTSAILWRGNKMLNM